jgi:alanyl-tRNA synthetase
MKTDEIRGRFLEFFKARGHKVIPSDSLVPQNDPTLLFTGAGMNQFKDYFLGLKRDMKRAASSQKCLRTGDLDEVGRTAYHHSFFEMLGNFSFGDYFKKEAIEWAWEFLTREIGLPEDRLQVSVHESDEEAYRLWREVIKVPEKRITRLGDKTNFWPSNAPREGPNGPCGPCSEIYYDQGEGSSGKAHACSVDHDCGRFAEIWNLVFTQYDRQEGGELVPLRQKNIDTGMGLERIACVAQGKRTNYEIDLFQPIVKDIEKALKINRDPGVLPHLYAIADHLRAVTFAIADGVIPGNEGRNYVIRKLIRRAIWHAYQVAKERPLEEPLLYELVPCVVSVMRTGYPDLSGAQRNVEDTLKGEEERFLRTLSTGLALLSEKMARAKEKGRRRLSGEEVFILYDTYGFPDELTRVIAEGEGFEIDQGEFNRLMEAQRKRAKGTSPLVQSIFVTSGFDERLHSMPPSTFLGYETHSAKVKVLISQVEENRGIVVLDRTPFYAESGGQVGDQGVLTAPDFEAKVGDTQKRDAYHLHFVEIVKGRIREGMEVEARVDSERRNAAMRNHTATHLLHAVLREVLGKHVRQLGSLVHPDRLRFDYSFSRPLTEEEIVAIELRVNAEIVKDTAVQKEVKAFEEARGEGAIAFFGEKYGEKVRVVSVPGISKELCGGTHCERTGQIGLFVILNDSSIASGVRRIEALTGEGAMRYVQTLRSQMEAAAAKLKTTPSEIVGRIGKLQERMKKLEKGEGEARGAAVDPKKMLGRAVRVGSYGLIVENVGEGSRESLRRISDQLRSQAKKSVWVLVTQHELGKVHFVAGLSSDLKEGKLDVRELVRGVGPLLGGGGGGRKDLAEGGGTNLEILKGAGIEAVREKAKQYLQEAK